MYKKEIHPPFHPVICIIVFILPIIFDEKLSFFHEFRMKISRGGSPT